MTDDITAWITAYEAPAPSPLPVSAQMRAAVSRGFDARELALSLGLWALQVERMEAALDTMVQASRQPVSGNVVVLRPRVGPSGAA